MGTVVVKYFKMDRFTTNFNVKTFYSYDNDLNFNKKRWFIYFFLRPLKNHYYS